MNFIHITDVDLSTQVRATLNAFVGPPNFFSGCSLTAKALKWDSEVSTLMKCADEAALTAISARAALDQFFTEVRRGNPGIEVLLERVRWCPALETHSRVLGGTRQLLPIRSVGRATRCWLAAGNTEREHN